MDLSTSILGKSTTQYLQQRQTAAILEIGTDRYDRAALSRVQCYNFLAAANLSRLLNRDLKVKNTRDVFENVPPEALAIPRLGSVALAVLGACFEAKGIGGDAPLEAWYRKHHPGAKLVTFDALKVRDAAEHAAERKQQRARKAARRDHAQRLRRERFMKRAG